VKANFERNEKPQQRWASDTLKKRKKIFYIREKNTQTKKIVPEYQAKVFCRNLHVWNMAKASRFSKSRTRNLFLGHRSRSKLSRSTAYSNKNVPTFSSWDLCNACLVSFKLLWRLLISLSIDAFSASRRSTWQNQNVPFPRIDRDTSVYWFVCKNANIDSFVKCNTHWNSTPVKHRGYNSATELQLLLLSKMTCCSQHHVRGGHLKLNQEHVRNHAKFRIILNWNAHSRSLASGCSAASAHSLQNTGT